MADSRVDYRASIQPAYPDSNLLETVDSPALLDKVDGDKIKSVLRRSLIWVVLIVILFASGAYLAIRYTKPVYESISVIKLNFKSEANTLGLGNLSDNSNINYLSGEIELLRSRLFFSQVVKSLPLEVSYYTKGHLLDDEKYKESPFSVAYTVRNPSILNRQILVTILDEERYQILFPWQGTEGQPKEHFFGETISLPQLDLRLETTQFLTAAYIGEPMYFVLNSEESLLRYIADNLSVSPLNVNANTIRLSFRDYNRHKARDLVASITSVYQSYTKDQKNQANEQKINFLNDQLEQTENRLDQYEAYFENFTIRNKTTNLSGELQNIIQQIVQIDTALGNARLRQKALNSLYNTLIDSATTPLASALFPELNRSLEEYNKLKEEEARLLLSYDSRTLTVRRVQQKLQISRDNLLDQIDFLGGGFDTEIRNLVRQKSQLETRFVKLPAQGTEFNQAERFYKLYEEFYLTLMQRRAEFEIAQAGTTTEFVILTPASLPAGPISPNRLFILGIGILGGIFVSIILVITRYLIHNTITGLSELEKLTATPVLGGIPSYKGEKLHHTRMIISKNPKSSISEAFRSVRTNMEFLSSKDGIKTISVTSTISGEGKTFVCANLGGIISLSGQRVVIVDLDMRRPRIHLAFQQENPTKGTSTILIQKHSISECVMDTEFENLSYIPVGPVPPNPSELLLSEAFNKMVAALKEEYDVVIFDTPPIGLVTDGILVMKKVDLPIYVFRADYSKRVFARTLQRLRTVNKFNNLSVILNAMKTNSGQGYGYGYGYTYGYYQDEGKSNKFSLRKLLRR